MDFRGLTIFNSAILFRTQYSVILSHTRNYFTQLNYSDPVAKRFIFSSQMPLKMRDKCGKILQAGAPFARKLQ